VLDDAVDHADLAGILAAEDLAGEVELARFAEADEALEQVRAAEVAAEADVAEDGAELGLVAGDAGGGRSSRYGYGRAVDGIDWRRAVDAAPGQRRHIHFNF
jgi:hypothetical protein